jgi:hypothetical protein
MTAIIMPRYNNEYICLNYRALQRYLRFLWAARRVAQKDLTIADIFREHAVRSPNKVIFMFENTEWTAQQVSIFVRGVSVFVRLVGDKLTVSTLISPSLSGASNT